MEMEVAFHKVPKPFAISQESRDRMKSCIEKLRVGESVDFKFENDHKTTNAVSPLQKKHNVAGSHIRISRNGYVITATKTAEPWKDSEA